MGGGILPPISAGEGTGAGPENDQGYWAVQWHSPSGCQRCCCADRAEVVLRQHSEFYQ